MLQIIHDVAPRAKECFATAFTASVGFADEHPRAGRQGRPVRRRRHHRRRRLLRRAVLRPTARSPTRSTTSPPRACQYFSSAGNGSSQQAYQAPLRIVAPDKPDDRSNIDLSDGVDPTLYAGGFHDFDPGPGVDVAQDVSLGGDANGRRHRHPRPPVGRPDRPQRGSPLGDPKVARRGAITAAAPIASIPFDGTAGETIRGLVDAIPSGTTDLILTLKDPDGNVLQQVDTGTSPETRRSRRCRRPARTRSRSPASTATSATSRSTSPRSSAKSRTIDGPQRAVLRRRRATSCSRVVGPQPVLGQAVRDRRLRTARGPLQLVISKGEHRRGHRDAAALPARRTTCSTTSTSSRSRRASSATRLARGANAVAAYDPFRPFAARGLHVGRRRPADPVRLGTATACRSPTSGASRTWRRPTAGTRRSSSPTPRLDPDDQPNFFGTSAAAPHAAGIAALVAAGARRAGVALAGARCGRCSSAARSRTTSTPRTAGRRAAV